MNRRRALCALLAPAVVMLGLATPAAPAAADSKALSYMRTVADDLLAAQRSGTINSFSRAIRKHADVQGISLYSLGAYASRLPNGSRESYFNGVTTFMARYFADQTRLYRVAKAEVLDAAKGKEGEIVVNTRVTLLTGDAYTVAFGLAPRGNGYKVVDVKVQVPVLGFVSLTYQQRGIFQKYLAQQGGDVNALVTALNR